MGKLGLTHVDTGLMVEVQRIDTAKPDEEEAEERYEGQIVIWTR